jgi:hypothetical protein
MRDVLDLAGYGLAVASGAVDPQHTNFPFAPNAVKFEEQVRGRCKDLPDDIVMLFRSLKPYKGGNDLLWALNCMAVTDKHKLLIPIAVKVGMDLPPVLRQTVKTQNPLNGELSHGIVS